MILRFKDYEQQRQLQADVVVVGTGAGGGVCGTELALAGLDVVFVEEGSHFPTESFSPYATESVPRLYRDASSTVLFGKPDIPYLEGRCVGGSTVINGGMTWRAPEKVLSQWGKDTDGGLGPERLEPHFQRVEAQIHAKPQHATSVGDAGRILCEGAKKLGWRFELNRRNQEACVGSNNCVFGCPTGAKQSTLVSYLPRAFQAGARCLTELRVERLLIERGRAVGVVGRAVDPRTRQLTHEVTVRARAVVVAAGAVQTPYLLLRHGLGRPSGLLGKNLSCHPNVKLLAVYPFDVRAWQGVNQYGQVREFHDEGIVMADNHVAPGAMAALIPRVGRGAWELMKRYNQIVATGVLVEDSSTGTVSRSPLGMAWPRYDITAYDHQRFVRGAKLLAELHFAMGAEYVTLPFLTHPIVRSMDEVRRISVENSPLNTLELLTVHIMGTAAMGCYPGGSVTNLDGELWDLPGCYVADASLFPTPIGVNPQVTIMALATHVAERLAERTLAAKAADTAARSRS